MWTFFNVWGSSNIDIYHPNKINIIKDYHKFNNLVPTNLTSSHYAHCKCIPYKHKVANTMTSFPLPTLFSYLFWEILPKTNHRRFATVRCYVYCQWKQQQLLYDKQINKGNLSFLLFFQKLKDMKMMLK